MEAVTVAASIIAIIQISDRVINYCRFYIQAVSGTPSDLRAIFVEISALKCIIENLQFLQSCDQTAPAWWVQLSSQNGPIEECKRSISDLEKLFPPESDSSGGKQPGTKRRKKDIIQRALASLAWPLKAGRARELLQHIIHQKTLINLALTIDFSQEIKAIKKDTTKIHNVLTESQCQEVYRWLVQTDPSPIHNRNWKLHELETSNWMLRSIEWNRWLSGDIRCIWIHGIPGAGKTILTSFLVEQVEGYCQNRDRTANAYYYCYFGHDQDESYPFLRWIISQLCGQAKSVPDRVYELYHHGRQPSLTDLLLATEDSLQAFDVAYVILDAVDESKPRQDLLKVLRDLATDVRFSKLRCLITSREYVDIEEALEDISHSVSMSNELVKEDIRKHVHNLLHSKPRFQNWPTVLRDEVEEAITSKSKGMFRWAVCLLERLQRLKGDRAIIENALATLPKTLDETYERIFLDIPREEWVFARHVLQWLCFHQDLYKDTHPMALRILLTASQLSAGIEVPEEQDLEYDSERVQSMLGCLITIGSNGNVYLAHYTVKEYLESHRISESGSKYFCIKGDMALKVCAPIIYRKALTVNWQKDKGEKLLCEDNYTGITPDAILQDFETYCAASGMILLAVKQKEIASEKSIVDAAADFLNPTREHFDHMMLILDELQNDSGFFYTVDSPLSWKFLHWANRPEPEGAGILLNSLIFSNNLEFPVLADMFSQRLNMKRIALSKVKLEVRMEHYERSGTEDSLYTVGDSLLEVAAQLDLPEKHFVWLLEKCDIPADMAGLLMAATIAIPYRWGEDEGHGCPLQELLRKTVDPNGTGYQVTPLQVAILFRHIPDTKMLLEAGADPNASGNPSGLQFKQGSILEHFNWLHGQSPLHICRNSEIFSYGNDLYNPRKRENSEINTPIIEDLLLKAGAKDFILSPSSGSSSASTA